MGEKCVPWCYKVNLQGEVVYTTLLNMVCEVFYICENNCCWSPACSPKQIVTKTEDGCWFGGKLIQKLRQKGVYEEAFQDMLHDLRGSYSKSCIQQWLLINSVQDPQLIWWLLIVIDIHSWGSDLYVASSWFVYVHIVMMILRDLHHHGGRNVYIGVFIEDLEAF